MPGLTGPKPVLTHVTCSGKCCRHEKVSASPGILASCLVCCTRSLRLLSPAWQAPGSAAPTCTRLGPCPAGASHHGTPQLLAVSSLPRSTAKPPTPTSPSCFTPSSCSASPPQGRPLSLCPCCSLLPEHGPLHAAWLFPRLVGWCPNALAGGPLLNPTRSPTMLQFPPCTMRAKAPCVDLLCVSSSHTLERSTRGEPDPPGPGALAAGLCAEQIHGAGGTCKQSRLWRCVPP